MINILTLLCNGERKKKKKDLFARNDVASSNEYPCSKCILLMAVPE